MRPIRNSPDILFPLFARILLGAGYQVRRSQLFISVSTAVGGCGAASGCQLLICLERDARVAGRGAGRPWSHCRTWSASSASPARSVPGNAVLALSCFQEGHAAGHAGVEDQFPAALLAL